MRQDFRVKIDISRIYQDARQYSWVYVDSTKICYINQFANHVRKIFNVNEPFHLLSKYEDTCFFLPFEEDVRILANNDTVVIIPGTGINTDNACIMKNDVDSSSKIQSNSVDASKSKDSDTFSNQSYATDKSPSQNNIQNVSEIAQFNDTLYKTALHETVINGIKDAQLTEDTYTEDQSITEESPMTNKRKRVRKRKQKKPTDVVPESDFSINEISGKKPKIIDSILITSGSAVKHIRFKGLDDEEVVSGTTTYGNNVQQNGDVKSKQNVNKDLSALLSLRQSSTPLAFVHKRMKKEYIPESIQEQEMTVEADETSNQANTSLNSYKGNKEIEQSKIQTPSQRSLADDNTVSFKVFKIGDDYTPQVSKVIIAEFLSSSADGSQYTLKILHGKDQLREPEGKFALPKDEENLDDDLDDIVTLEKSRLLEFTRIKAIGTPN